jgi:hypothetical protein
MKGILASLLGLRLASEANKVDAALTESRLSPQVQRVNVESVDEMPGWGQAVKQGVVTTTARCWRPTPALACTCAF